MDAIALNEKLLDQEGGVDKAYQRFDVGFGGDTESKRTSRWRTHGLVQLGQFFVEVLERGLEYFPVAGIVGMLQIA